MASQPPYQRILLLTEDVGEQRIALQRTAERYFGDDKTTTIRTAISTGDALRELGLCASHSPNAKLYGVLDYNMGKNLPGEKRPTEALFYDPTFQSYLTNGGIVVIYSGLPEQVRQSDKMMGTPQEYPNTALLVAEKARVSLDDLFRFLATMPPERIAGLRSRVEPVNYSLGTLLEQIRGRG